MNAQKLFSKKWIVFATAVLCTLLWGSAFPGIKTGYRMFRIASQDTADQLMFAGARFFDCRYFDSFDFFFCGEKRSIKRNGESSGRKRTDCTCGICPDCFAVRFYYIGIAHVTGVKGAILNGSTAFFVW